MEFAQADLDDLESLRKISEKLGKGRIWKMSLVPGFRILGVDTDGAVKQGR